MRTGPSTLLFPIACLLTALAQPAQAQRQDTVVRYSMRGAIYKPAQVPATAERVAGLRVPSGFRVQVFAGNLGKPRMLAVDAKGNVYVSLRDSGQVLLLRDTNGDGRADERRVVARIPQAHGLALHQGKLYVAAVNALYVAAQQPDGSLDAPRQLLDDLPDGGQHPNRTLAFGPDGNLYLSVGSSCNACDETNPEHATLLVLDPDGRNRRIYAQGLRNTIGFGWHPPTRRLFGMDHGMDWLGDDEGPEELNELQDGAHYGWPYVYADGKPNLADAPPNGMTYAAFAARATPPRLTYQAHAAPLGLVFYTGTQFPAEYRNDAFVTLRGSWNRSAPVGYSVVRVRFDTAGNPLAFEDFVQGFVDAKGGTQFGRPCGIAVHPDGSLLVSDDSNGMLYRIAYGR